MQFRLILRKTLIDLTGWRTLPVLLVIGLSVPLLVSLAWRNTLELQAFSSEMKTYYVVSNFLTIAFVWTAGVFLAFLVATNAAGAISREVSEGTLLTLVSKTISRRQIVLGKFAAISIHAFLIEAIILTLLTVILWFMLPMGTPTFIALLGTVPWILLYSLLVILVFGAISMLLSSLVESQITIMVIITVAILFFFFGILGQMLGLPQDVYEKYHLYLFDGSYNLGNAFAPILSRATGNDMLPTSQLGLLHSFTGVFVGGREAAGGITWQYVAGASWFSYPGELAGYVKPAVSIAALIVIGTGAMWLASWFFQRRDVG